MNPSTCKQFGWIQDANDQKLWRNKKGKIMVKTYSWQDGLMDYGHLYETYTSNGTMILIAEEAMKNIYGGADILIEFQDIIHRSAQNLTLSKSFQKKCSLDF